MLLHECYACFGGDYESVRQRIPREELIEKFVKKFLTEPSYSDLCCTLQEENYTEAFRAAHSLKGVSANLGFRQLEQSASALTECLRNSEEKQIDKNEAEDLLGKVSADYKEVIDAILKYEET